MYKRFTCAFAKLREIIFLKDELTINVKAIDIRAFPSLT